MGKRISGRILRDMETDELRNVLEEFVEPRTPDDFRRLDRALDLAVRDRDFEPTEEDKLQAVEDAIEEETRLIRTYLLALDNMHRAETFSAATYRAWEIRPNEDSVRIENNRAQGERAQAEKRVIELQPTAEGSITRLRRLRRIQQILQNEKA
jgi:hypothetical protein